MKTELSNPHIQIFKGYHSADLVQSLSKAWQLNQTLVVCPAHMDTVPFINDNNLMAKIPKDIVLGVFTSGTVSGKPRLILYTKKNIESSLRSIRELYDVKKIDKIFCYPQPTHAFGLILGYIHAQLFSIPLVFLEGRYSSEAHAKWIAEATPGMLTLGTPTHFMDLIHWVQKNKIQPKETYSAIIGGAAVTKKLWTDAKNELRIDQPSIGYGASEASPGVTHLKPGVSPLQDGDIGELLSGVTLEEKTSSGYFFKGDNLCAGIIDENGFQQPERIYIKDDLVETASGHFVFEGRSDLLINRGGLKISPENLEGKLFSDLGLKSVCVPVFNERLGQDVGFVVQKKSDEDLELSQKLKVDVIQYLKEHCFLNLSEENIVIDDIPLNSSAKFDRIESYRLILKSRNIQAPVRIDYLTPFLPHRLSAVWIRRITQFEFRHGRGEVDLDTGLNAFTNNHLRESSCIEMVAQTYGYATAANMIFNYDPKQKANKTLIAEVRNSTFYFSDETDKLVEEAISKKIPLKIEAKCSHDFGMIKVIQGSVRLNDVLLAEVNLKAYVAP